MAQLVAELRAFLQEHHRALKSFCTPATEDSQRGVFWLEEHDRLYPERVWNVYQLRDVRHALSALSILARVSSAACWEEMQAIWPVLQDLGAQEHAFESVGMIVTVRNADSLLPVKDSVESKPSVGFQALSARIENALGGDGATEVRVPILLDVQKRYHRRGPGHQTVFEKMVQFVRCLSEKQQVQSILGRPLIHQVSVKSLEFLDASELNGLVDLMQDGVKIESFPRLKGASTADMAHRRGLLRVLSEAMLLSEPLRYPETGTTSSRVVINVDAVGTNMMALMSAVAESRSLKSASICFTTKPTVDAQARLSHLKWLAYGLFSCDTSHSLEFVDLDVGDMTCDEVDVMRAVVSSVDPLFSVLGFPTDLLLPKSVIASRYYLKEPTSQTLSEDLAPYQMSTPVSARIIGQDGNFWSVWLPGFGEAWVNIVDVLELFYGSDPPACSHALSRVSIHATNECSNAAILRLLSLFGCRVKELELNVRLSPVGMDIWVLSMLEACPRIEALKWSSTWAGNLSVLTTKAATGAWNLHTLELYETRPVEKEQLSHLLSVLSDATHPFTAKLRTLNLHLNMVEADLGPFAKMFGKMLDANRRLVRIQLHFTSQVAFPIQAELLHVLKKQSDQVVQVPDKQFPDSSKLAFLSVFSRMGNHEGAFDLSEDVVSSVFEYAGGVCTRQFRVSFRK